MKNFSKIICLLVFTIQSAQQHEASKCKVQTINSIDEFEKILKEEPRIIVNFFGACGHCPPGKAIFNQLVESTNTDQIKFYEFKVNDKPVILEKYDIQLRPTVMGFVDGVETPVRYVRDQVTEKNFLKLMQILLTYRSVRL